MFWHRLAGLLRRHRQRETPPFATVTVLPPRTPWNAEDATYRPTPAPIRPLSAQSANGEARTCPEAHETPGDFLADPEDTIRRLLIAAIDGPEGGPHDD